MNETEFYMKYFKKLDHDNKTMSRQKRNKWHCIECGESFKQIILTSKERGGGKKHLLKKHKISYDDKDSFKQYKHSQVGDKEQDVTECDFDAIQGLLRLMNKNCLENNTSNIDEEIAKYKKKSKELVDDINKTYQRNEDLEVEKGIYKALLAYKARRDAKYTEYDDDEYKTMNDPDAKKRKFK